MATESSHKSPSFMDNVDTGLSHQAFVTNDRGARIGSFFFKAESNLEELKAGFTMKLDSKSPMRFVIDENHRTGEYAMSSQDKYIDARLAGIESKLDARLDAMQRFQEQADSRFERITDRLYDEISGLRSDVSKESESSRRHATTTAWATVAGVFAGFAIVIAVAGYWISEQGSYAKSYGETQVDIQRAETERSEFREAVQAIQSTQQSILERLPPQASE